MAGSFRVYAPEEGDSKESLWRGIRGGVVIMPAARRFRRATERYLDAPLAGVDEQTRLQGIARPARTAPSMNGRRVRALHP